MKRFFVGAALWATLVGAPFLTSLSLTSLSRAEAPTPNHIPLAEPDALSQKINRTLDTYHRRGLDAQRRSPWAIMHWIVGFGTDAMLRTGQPDADRSAIGYLCFGGRGNGPALLYVDSKGQLATHRGPGVEGHDGQFLGYLGQSRLKGDYPIKVDGRDFTIADLIDYEKRTCRNQPELTYKLMSLAHYLPTTESWKNEAGETWTIDKLIKGELSQEVRTAACGGTHRLMGLSVAVRKRRFEKLPMEGEFWRAEKFIDDYQKYAYSLQNADGSFSTQWFWRKESSADAGRRLDTTGHTLEWMVYSLPVERLREERVTKAMNYLADLLMSQPQRDWEIGPLGHSMHALVLYEERVYGQWKAPEPAASVAAKK